MKLLMRIVIRGLVRNIVTRGLRQVPKKKMLVFIKFGTMSLNSGFPNSEWSSIATFEHSEKKCMYEVRVDVHKTKRGKIDRVKRVFFWTSSESVVR